MDIENCAVFEDAILGIEAAKRANASKIIAVSSTLNTNKLSSIDGVSYVIKDFTKISIDNLYSKTSLKQNSKIMTILLRP